MASRASKPQTGEPDLIPEGPDLDALVKAMVAEAVADPRPSIPMEEAFKRIRANIAGSA